MFTVGIFLPTFASAVIFGGGGGGGTTRYYATRTGYKSSTKYAEKSSTQYATKTGTYNGYSVTLDGSGTALATASGYSYNGATRTRSSTISQTDANNKAQAAADSAAQSLADFYAQNNADYNAQIAADAAAQAEADIQTQAAADNAAYKKWLWHAGPATIGVEWETVQLLSGNTYRFKVKLSSVSYASNLKLLFNDYKNEYYTTREGFYYFDEYGNRIYEYLYNYVDIEVAHNWYRYTYIGAIEKTETFSQVEQGPPDHHLLLVHGYGGYSNGWNQLVNYEPFMVYYGPNINAIDYYGDHAGFEPQFAGVTVYTPIEVVGAALAAFILVNYQAGDTLDILSHSMGGLVTRYMIKNYYSSIKNAGITIKHVGTAGTPNHGIALYTLTNIPIIGGITLAAAGTQVIQMATGSKFLMALNFGDETPYSVGNGGFYDTIEWSTYAIAAPNAIMFWTDGVVDTWSIPLSGASNHHYTEMGSNEHDSYLLQTNFYIMDDMFEELSDGASLPILPPLNYNWGASELVTGTQYRFKVYINPEHAYDTKVVINGQNYPMQTYYISSVYQYHYFIKTLEEEKLYLYYFKGKDISGYWYQSDKDIEIIADPLTISHQFFDDGYLFGPSTRTALDFAHYQDPAALDATLYNFGSDSAWVDGAHYGQWGGALEFDGIDDYATIPNYIFPTGELTVSLLVNSMAVGNLGTLISYKNPSGVEEFSIVNEDDGYGDPNDHTTFVYIKGQKRLWDTLGWDYVSGGWVHIAVVYSDLDTVLYVNGIQADINGGYWGELTPGGTLTIGEGFEGTMDELFIMNRRLSDYGVENMWKTYWGL